MPGCRSAGIRPDSRLRATCAAVFPAPTSQEPRASRTRSRDRSTGGSPTSRGPPEALEVGDPQEVAGAGCAAQGHRVASRPPRQGGPMSIVIVGAGLAGGTAATELREQGYDGPVVLVGSEAHAPTSARRCPRATCSATTRSTTPSCTRPTGTPSTTSTCGSASRRRRSTPTPTWCTRDRRAAHLRAAAARHRGRAATARARRGERCAHGLPAHDRGQRPAQGGLREGRPDRRRRSRLDRAGDRRGGARGRAAR